MEYIIAVYRSRNVSFAAYNYLLSQGVTASLISTPRSANVGCGLSVRFAKSAFPIVKSALGSAETFVGFFLVKSTFGGNTVVRI